MLGQCGGPICKGRAIQEECHLHCLTPENGSNRFSKMLVTSFLLPVPQCMVLSCHVGKWQYSSIRKCVQDRTVWCDCQHLRSWKSMQCAEAGIEGLNLTVP
jgi:hypothetical protein